MIIEIIGTAIFIVAIWLVLRYNLHMFQLNGYKNKEHISWLKKKYKTQTILGGVFILSLFTIVVNDRILSLIGCLFLSIVIIKYYNLYKESNKKKFVVTPRVRRMIITNAIIIVGVSALYVVSTKRLIPILLLLTFMQSFIVLLLNIINSPIERAIKNHYISDAKRILNENKHIKVIGVTGSYGKTSVKFYLQKLLQEKYNVLVTPESYNTPMGIVKTIRSDLKNTHDIFVCEMGARYVGDIKEICDIVKPTHGVITAVGPQHLETFGSIMNIIKTKFELADALPKEGMLFLNVDNEIIRAEMRRYSNAVAYSTTENIGYNAGNIKVSTSGTSFTVTSPSGEKEEFHTKLIGMHNVINIISAISVANTLNIPLGELIIPVRRLQPIPHRMEITNHKNFTIIDDAYNSNPVGSKAALNTLSMFDGTKILVTPGMVELGNMQYEYNYNFGTYAAECCDYIFLIGKNQTRPIYEGVCSKGFPESKCVVCDNLEEAMSFIKELNVEKWKYVLLENDLPDNY